MLLLLTSNFLISFAFMLLAFGFDAFLPVELMNIHSENFELFYSFCQELSEPFQTNYWLECFSSFSFSARFFIQSLIRLLFLCIQGGTQSRNSTIYNYCHSFLQINNLKWTKKFSDLFGCPFARREVFHFFNLKLDTEGYLTNKADSFQPTYTCSELTIETSERRQRCQTYFTPFLVFLLFTLNK